MIRTKANALITLAAAAALTPNWRAKAGMLGDTIPNPSATVNDMADRIATSRGSPAKGPRDLAGASGTPGILPAGEIGRSVANQL